MWKALFAAVLEWLTGLVKELNRKTGEDAPVNTEASGKINHKLEEWKKKSGAP